MKKLTDVTDVHFWVYVPRTHGIQIADSRENFLCYEDKSKFYTPVFSTEDFEAVTCKKCKALLASIERQVAAVLVEMEKVVPAWHELFNKNRQVKGMNNIEEALTRLLDRLKELRTYQKRVRELESSIKGFKNGND